MAKPIYIRNRPIEHYLLSIFSLLLQGEKEIVLKSFGSINGRTIDLAYLIKNNILPETFDIDVKCNVEDVSVGDSTYKASSITVILAKVK